MVRHTPNWLSHNVLIENRSQWTTLLTRAEGGTERQRFDAAEEIQKVVTAVFFFFNTISKEDYAQRLYEISKLCLEGKGMYRMLNN